MFIPRHLTEYELNSESQRSNVEVLALDELRSVKSWVLLGEPGSGKSTAFEEECKYTGGKKMRIDEFLDEDLLVLADYPIIYLDGLDEARNTTTEGRTLIGKVAKKLIKLSCPPFRISCRAADWHGELPSST